MAIYMMTDKETLSADRDNVEVVHDYSGAESGVRHSPRCPHHTGHTIPGVITLTEECVGDISYTEAMASGGYEYMYGCNYRRPLYMHTTHRGLVLSTREMNGYDDSDFYALVWDAESQSPREIMYASTRGWTYPNNAWVDATPDVRAAYEAYCDAKRAAAALAAAEAEKRRVARGKRVRVVKGRKVAKGTEGLCMWYGDSAHGPRVGIATSERRDASGRYADVVWVAASNVEVVL